MSLFNRMVYLNIIDYIIQHQTLKRKFEKLYSNVNVVKLHLNTFNVVLKHYKLFIELMQYYYIILRLIGRRHNSAIELHKAEPFDIMNLSSDEDLITLQNEVEKSLVSTDEDDEDDNESDKEDNGLGKTLFCSNATLQYHCILFYVKICSTPCSKSTRVSFLFST